MFNSLRKLIADFGDDAKPAALGETDNRLAAAALLVHTATIDGSIADAERAQLLDLIKHRFDLDDDEAEDLIAEATAAEQRSIDLYQFTARLNRAFDEAARARMIEMMWQIVYADGTVTEFEDNLIWRAADLLHVPRGERIALRERVAAARSHGGKVQ